MYHCGMITLLLFRICSYEEHIIIMILVSNQISQLQLFPIVLINLTCGMIKFILLIALTRIVK
jgi:hypothetical protein